MQPLSPREGRAPHLLLVRARNSGRAAFKLCAVKVLHAGHQHIKEKHENSKEIFLILRNGAAKESGARLLRNVLPRNCLSKLCNNFLMTG